MSSMLKVGILSSTLFLGVPSCQKVSLKSLPESYVPSVVVNRVDSFILESKKILHNPEYQTFKKDTLKLTNDFITNPVKFFQNLDKTAQKENPRVVTKTYTVMVPSIVHKWRVVEPQVRHEYSKKFIDEKAIILSKNFYTTDSSDIQVPVEYIGIPNPMLKDKNF